MGTGAQSPGHADRQSTFVGRADHLDRLRDLLDRAAGGTPGALLVEGEVGAGKSRLLREFAKQVQASRSQMLWGSCIALGAGELPYAPLIDALRRLARTAGVEDVETLAGPGYRELVELVSDFTARTGAGATGAGDPESSPVSAASSGGQARVFRAVLRMLDHLGTDRPVVFVIEDLQWADSSTLDLFSFLARTRTDERLLLIGSYRTTGLPPRHPLRMLVAEWEVARLVDRMEVSPFTRGDLREFLRNALPAPVTHDLVERTFELTDGNALFVEEVVATGALTASAKDGVIALPGTLRGLLLPRFHLLSDDAQQVMGVAAAAGRRVSHSLLATVCELPPGRLLSALRESVATQMLVADPIEETYVFRHALLREVVYQALIPVERLQLHSSIAQALDGNSDLSYAEQLTVAAELSYHWYAARVYPQALAAAVRAGHDALRLFAFREAGRQFDRALEVWELLPDAAEIAGLPKHRLLSAAAEAARWAGRIERAVELAYGAVSEVDPMRHPTTAGETYERLGSYLWEAGDNGGAERAYTRAADLLDGAPPSAVAARVLAVRATAHVRNGQTAEGLRLGREALEMARSVGAGAAEGRALNTIGIAQCLQGQVEEGAAALREAIRIADGTNQLEDLFRAYGNLVYALEHAGEPDRAVVVAVEGLDRARRTGLEHTRGRRVLANNLCAALLLLGRWDEAVRIIEQIREDHPAAERLFPSLTLAEIAVARGRFEDAEELLAEVREVGASVTQPQFVGALRTCAAEIAIWRGDTGAARAAVADGLRAVADADDVVVRLRLCALGLRAEADERARRAARRGGDRQRSGIGSPALDDLGAELDRLTTPAGSAVPEVAALRALCRAERQRAGGPGPAPAWADVAAGWEALRRPYSTAYARWREAEAAANQAKDARLGAAGRTRATHEQAAAPAREAHRLAVELGAGPLRDGIEMLARGARIDLTVAGKEQPAAPGRAARSTSAFGLTERELEVLAYVSAGWSNRRIAQQLFIKEKSVGVHVSNILRKLEVPTRGEAAAVATRHHLVDPPAST